MYSTITPNVENAVMKKNYFNLLKKSTFFFLFLLFTSAHAQINWDQSELTFNVGDVNNGVTSMMYGPDGRLYVAEYPGLIKIFTINRIDSKNYEVTAVEELNGIQTMQDHNDDGTPFTSTERETTGLTVAGTATNPVIYVSSSDFRIGAGSGGGNGDVGLDTNSGVITRFSWNGSSWDVVDLVRGLPRSEENHATNGLEMVEINGTNYLIVASGGITNAGSPSVNFVFTCEYALSGAVLSINLDMLNSMPVLDDNGRSYIYDLPTLDDPTRANVNGIIDPDDPGYDGIDVNDPWGGNDGLNMAIYDPTGPVDIVSPGYRNAYDLVVTENKALYVTDNGANGGWGGLPANEGPGTATNAYNPAEPGSATPDTDGEIIDNVDHLHVISTDLTTYNFGDFYGGHPNPIRANPTGAGLYTDNGSNAVWRTQLYDPDGSTPGSTTNPNIGLPANWASVVPAANPEEGDWRSPTASNPDGPDDNPVVTWGTNTNGIDEYTASNFGGVMKGDLIAGVNTGVIRRVQLNPDGSSAGLTSTFLSGLGGNALGITCNGDTDIFPGTIWAGTLNGKIVVFEPQDFVTCILPGDPGYDPNGDNDFDGYTNDDEDQSGTDMCNGGSQPDDFDKSAGAPFTSNLLDTDDDNDGIADSADPFQLGDPETTGSDAFTVPITNALFNDQQGLGGIFGLGMTGLMNNGDTGANWLDWIDRRDDPNDPNPNDVLGGAPGIMTSHMTSGTAFEGSNTQEKGYQYGVQTDLTTGPFTVIGGMNGFTGPLRLYGNTAAIGGELGFFIGDGTQSNYIKFVVTTDGFTALQEINDVAQTPITFTVPEVDRPSAGIVFYFAIDPATGVVQLEYNIDDAGRVVLGTITAQGSILDAIQQNTSDLAVGFIGTSGVAGVELEGSWDFLNVVADEPYIVQDLPNLERLVSSADDVIDLDTYFGDDFGVANLTYTVETNSNPNVTTSITGNELTISYPATEELANITVRATDGGGLFVEQTFQVLVTIADQILFRVNAGGPQITAIDGDIDWAADDALAPSIYLTEAGSNTVFPSVGTNLGNTIDASSVPPSLFTTERYDDAAGTPNMTYSFPVPEAGNYEIRLYLANSFDGTQNVGDRVFDINIEGNIAPQFDDIDLISLFGHQTAGVLAQTLMISDGFIDIEFIHGVADNPVLNAIEIIKVSTFNSPIYITNIPDQFNALGDVLDGSLGVVAFGGTGNLSFEATGLPPGVFIEPTNGQIGGTIDPSADTTNPYVVTVTVDDMDGTEFNQETATFNWTIVNSTAIRINAGGTQYNTPFLGNVWSDNSVVGAQSSTRYSVNTGEIIPTDGNVPFILRDNSIPGYFDKVTFDVVFGQERFDLEAAPAMEYNIPVNNGTYEVRLYFANSFDGTSVATQRIFDVLIEGTIIWDNLDLIPTFGHQVAGMLKHELEITDGAINISFDHLNENPLLNAIEVYRVDNTLDPLVISPISDQLNSLNDAVNLQVVASGGDLGQSFSYFMNGAPEGLVMNATTGLISGVITPNAATGGPQENGTHAVKVTVLKEGSAPIDFDFTWDLNDSWIEKDEDLSYTGRHEHSFVQAGMHFYLMGGRENTRTVEIYDYQTNTWETLFNSAPFEFNHFQAVEYKGLIWAIGGLRNNTFPAEQAMKNVWVFDPVQKIWSKGPEIPESRRRGSAGVVVYNDKFYIAGGNINGHDGGFVSWFDEFDPATGTWTPLTDAPIARDHFFATLIDNKMVLAGGRQSGGVEGVNKPLVPQIDVYDFLTGTWSTLAPEDNLPTPRAGAAAVNFNDKLYVIGGEVENEFIGGSNISGALDLTEIYDFATGEWELGPGMNFPRHGAQALTSGDGIFILGGSPNLAGGNQKNMEYFGEDEPAGVALVGSEIVVPAEVLIADNTTETIALAIQNGVTGRMIESLEITGPNAADFAIVAGDINNQFFDTGASTTIDVQLTGDGSPKEATLEIILGSDKKILIGLANGNSAPNITAIDDQFNVNGDTVTLQVGATDGGTITYSATNLPPTLSIDPNTGLISGVIDNFTNYSKVYEEQAGVLVVETESADIVNGWGEATFDNEVGLIGDDDHFIAATGAVAQYDIQITTPGVYRFNWNSAYSGNSSTDENDSWLKLPNDDDVWFFGFDGSVTTEQALIDNVTGAQNNIVFPKGSSRVTPETTPEGAGAGGFFKVYRSGGSSQTYKWQATTSDNDGHDIYVYFVNAGTYTLDIGERSKGHAIERFALYKVDGTDFTGNELNALPESTITVSGTPGASLNSPYAVEITATDDAVPPLSTTENFTWFVGDGTNQPPFAVILADETNGDAPLTVNFTGSNSLDDFGVVSYAWEFGNGDTSTEADPTYTFTSPGDYIVSLTVTDAGGLVSTVTQPILVNGTNNPPNAVAFADVTSGNAPLAVGFSANNSTDDFGVVAFSWDFGNGDSSTDKNPDYTYLSGGVFTVTLTVTDAAGLSDTDTLTITVNGAPEAIATADVTSGNAPLTVNFTGSSSTDDNNDIVSYEWEFGTGDMSTDADPTYVFANGGVYTVSLTVTDGGGLSSTTTVDITVNAAPVAIATADVTSGNPPLTVNFTGSNSTDDNNDIVSYEWDFGTGDMSTDADPSYEFANAGVYSVSLTVTDGGGLTSTTTLDITVNGAPVAIATSDVTSGNAPLTVNFTGSSSTDDNNDIVSYEWDFGTGDMSTDADPTYVFANGGVYTVSLTVTDGGGLTSTATVDITVNGAPVAIASADVVSGNVPLSVNFTGSSSTDDNNDIVSYEWDFGTGDMSTDADPSYVFATAGVYSVSLTVTDGGGLTSTTTLNIAVNGAPVAIATANVTSGNAPLTVNFTGSNSTDDNNDIVSYAWDFGTGDSSTEADPTYVFNTGGVFTVSLTVTDGGGLSSTTTLDITVNGAPVAIATADVTTGDAPLTVNFTGSNSTDDNNDIVSYAWDFGTGDSSTEADPTYVFANDGNFTVTLTVTDGGGLGSSATIDMTVLVDNNTPPIARIVANPTVGDAPLPVIFDGSTSSDDSGIVSYFWDFADGTTSNQIMPVKTFDQPGTYVVELTVTDEKGISDTADVTITVNDPNANQAPVAIIGTSVTSGQAPLEVIFTGSNSTDDAGIVSYVWDFGDGSGSNETNPVYTYTTAGTYNATLTVTDAEGLMDTATVTITVEQAPDNEAPVAVASGTPLNGEAPLEVNFTGSNSTDDKGVVSYNWDFGDGTNSSEADPTHTFTGVGNFTVTLEVSDAEGLTDTAQVIVVVTEPVNNEAPDAVASATPLSGDAPLEVSFTGSASTDDNAVVSYSWDFKDGGTSNVADPVYTFTTPGTYEVVLTVSDAEGLTDTATVTITVNNSNMAPIAIASATPLSGLSPLVVNFSSSGSTDDTGIVSYEWDFGDGASSDQANPTHTYVGIGTYTAILTVRDAEGLSASASVQIEVVPLNAAPVAVASSNIETGEAPLLVQFTGSASTDDKEIVEYFWDFDDGVTSTEVNPSHVFNFAGTFQVVLRVEDEEGLSDSTTLTIVVTDNTPTGADSSLKVVIANNPPVDFAQVVVQNMEPGMVINQINLHDSSGRLIRTFIPQEVFSQGIYNIPVGTLRDELYFITVETFEGEKGAVRLLIRNR